MPDLASRDLKILRLNSSNNILRGDTQRRHALGVQPDPHRVLALPEDLGVAYTGRARDLLLQMHVRVVGDEELVISIVWRIEVNREHEIARRGADD